MDKDGLTGLNVRLAFEEAMAKVKQSTLAIVYFDVNNLKYTNDNMGHKYGDKLLLASAECLKSQFREEDIFRTGGDEFIVILEGVGPKIIENKLKNIADKMEELTKTDRDGVIYQIASGYCVGDGSMTKQEIEDKAEANMYLNKKELKRRHPIAGDPRGIAPTTEYREVRKKSSIEVKLPEDLDKDIPYITKVYTSTLRDTVTKCVCIGLTLICIFVFLLFI